MRKLCETKLTIRKVEVRKLPKKGTSRFEESNTYDVTAELTIDVPQKTNLLEQQAKRTFRRVQEAIDVQKKNDGLSPNSKLIHQESSAIAEQNGEKKVIA